VLGVIAPGHGVQVRDQGVAELHGSPQVAQGLRVIDPGAAVVERVVGAVDAQDGAEDAILHPAQVQLRRFDAQVMPADVVAPPAIGDISSGGGEVRLEGQRLPANERVAGEADRVAMVAQAAPAGEDEGSLACPPQIQKVEVVQPPQRVKTRQAGKRPLLPVQPPEVDPARFLRVVHDLEVGAGEAWIGDVEGNGLLAGGIDAHALGHLGVTFFMGMDALRRMEIQGGAQTFAMQEAEKPIRVGKERPVPGVTCPAAALVAGLRDVPVHVDDTDRQRYPVRFEVFDQGSQLGFRVGPVAAPPVAQRPARDQRRRAGDEGVIAQAGGVIMPVAEEVQILRPGRRPPRFQPAILVEDKRPRIVDDGPAGS